jgi:hypothetical protein
MSRDTPGELAALPERGPAPEGASRWHLRSFVALPGYIGALTVEGERLETRWWHCRDRTTRKRARQAPGIGW